MGEGTRTRPLRRATVLAVVAAYGLAAAAPAAAAPRDQPPPVCDRSLPAGTDPGGMFGDNGTFTVSSAGGAVITATLHLPDAATANAPVPVVLRTHGGGGSRGSLAPGKGNLTQVLIDAGYGVMTWDTRGHGESKRDTSGRAAVLWTFGAPDAEVQDARALIRVLARCRAIVQEAPGDPVLGWVGTSNGAGVQLNTAAQEPAVDAIVPRLTWGDLPRDLAPVGIPKTYVDLIVQNLVSSRVQFDPMIAALEQDARAGALSNGVRDWLGARSTTTAAGAITAPTLLLQGSVDTLFGLDSAFDLFKLIRAAGTPVKLVPHCMAHDIGDGPKKTCRSSSRLDAITVLWLDKYLKGTDADTGPALEWQAQDGRVRPADAVPANTVRKHVRRKKRRPLATIVGPGGSGGDTATYAAAVGTDEPPRSWAHVPLLGPGTACRPLFGAPRLRITGRVSGAEGQLFAELLDVEPGGLARTVNATTTPVRLRRGRFATTLDLHGVAWTVSREHRLVLELTAGSGMYLEPRRSFRVRVKSVRAALPSTLEGTC